VELEKNCTAYFLPGGQKHPHGCYQGQRLDEIILPQLQAESDKPKDTKIEVLSVISRNPSPAIPAIGFHIQCTGSPTSLCLE